jgi:hypothetical protein
MRTCVRMTAQGSATTRLQRALANPGTTAMQIRVIASELPVVGLEDALAILLGLRDREPASYARAAARWGARLVLEHRLSLSDAQLTLAALTSLDGPSPRPAVDALSELAEALGLKRIEPLLTAWRDSRPVAAP